MEVIVACALVIAAFLGGVTLGMSIEREASVRSCFSPLDTGAS
jgi:hypothetical protein